MSSIRRDELRAMLKSFGIQADEAVIAHLSRNPNLGSLHLRLTLHDLTDYGGEDPEGELAFMEEGWIGNQA